MSNRKQLRDDFGLTDDDIDDGVLDNLAYLRRQLDAAQRTIWTLSESTKALLARAEAAEEDLVKAQTRIAKLEEALRPFARFAQSLEAPPNWMPDGCPVNCDPGGISDLAVGAFRRARAALEGR